MSKKNKKLEDLRPHLQTLINYVEDRIATDGLPEGYAKAFNEKELQYRSPDVVMAVTRLKIEFGLE